jgi:hypothetical protein
LWCTQFREDEEGIMRRMLIAASVALLGFAGYALADGTIVRWNAVVGLQGHEVDTPNFAALTVGPMLPNQSWIRVEGGKVQLNLDTGQVQIQIQYVSWASHGQGITGNPIGSPLSGYPFQRAGTFVCDSVGRIGGVPQPIQTEAVYLDDTGSLNYKGRVDVPRLCRDYPDQIAFVFGGFNTSHYFAYGAARQLLNSDSH